MAFLNKALGAADNALDYQFLRMFSSVPANDTTAGVLLPPAAKPKPDNLALYKQGDDSPEAFFDLGRQYLEGRHYAQAAVQFNRSLQINPGNLDALNNLAFSLLAMGRVELALKSYKLAEQIAPHDSEILRGIANCYETQGNFELARGVYEDILKREPYNVECLYNLILIGDYTSASAPAKKLKKLYFDENTTDHVRILACFALAKIYESQNEHERAFTFYEAGNRLKFAGATYDEAATFHYLDLLEQTFSAEIFSDFKGLGIQDATPIFVLGMPRSGTTLVEHILASHSTVHGAGEITAMGDIVGRLIPKLTGLHTPQNIYHLNGSAFAQLAEHYVKSLKSYAPDNKSRVVDKMPTNFFNVGIIRLLMPNAKIIHCTRESMDTCWSMYRQHFNASHPYCYDQRALGRFYMRYERLMQHWHKVQPGAIYDVRYEQLVRAPEAVISGLLDHCGLAWEPQCLEFHKTKRHVITASARQVRQPIYTSSLQSWKPVEDKLGILRQALA